LREMADARARLLQRDAQPGEESIRRALMQQRAAAASAQLRDACLCTRLPGPSQRSRLVCAQARGVRLSDEPAHARLPGEHICQPRRPACGRLEDHQPLRQRGRRCAQRGQKSCSSRRARCGQRDRRPRGVSTISFGREHTLRARGRRGQCGQCTHRRRRSHYHRRRRDDSYRCESMPYPRAHGKASSDF
jgi:hypothetical protein